MANCGVTGSALDQAARVITGDTSGSKAVLSNLLGGGYAVFPTQQQPLSAPQHLPVAGWKPQEHVVSQGRTTTIQNQSSHMSKGNHTAMAPHATQRLQQQQAPTALRTSASMHHHQQHGPQMGWHGLQQQMQHQQAIMQQMLHQQQQMQQHQQQTDAVTDEAPAQPVSMEELAKAWMEATAEDEAAKPATVEELSQAWKEAQSELGVLDETWAQGTDDYFDQFNEAEEYTFANKVESTQQQQQDLKDWMEEGIRQFEKGNLREAIKAFEFELQVNNTNNSAAWRMLGRCHAENDMDRDAILCLEQAVDRDPYSVEARLALGVSYVNELNHARALEHLKAWITHNPQLAGLDMSEATDIYGSASNETGTASSAFEEVQRLLLKALDFSGDTSVRADIFEALGVVYNVSRDYGAAVDALQNACEQRPGDYQLWNKLGATLANSSQSEKALPAYHRALQLKAKYARAWLNMAISHSNLEQYDDAARCYLQTLSLNPNATHCWSYLRIALSCAERWDLIPLVAAQDLESLRQHFDFVLYPTEQLTET